MGNDKNRPWLVRFLRDNPGVSICIAIALGIATLVGALCIYANLCTRNAPDVNSYTCRALRTNPPWSLLTALVAGLPAALTWYWRTVHKLADLEAARSQELTSRFTTAVELLQKGAPGSLYALERISQDSERDHWAVIETIAGYVRLNEYQPDNVGPSDKREVLHAIQAAMKILGRRDVTRDPPGRHVDLTGADLREVDFNGLDFHGARFERANLMRASLEGGSFRDAHFDQANLTTAKCKSADFTGATFNHAIAVGVRIDASTKIDHMGWMMLLAGEAKDDFQVERNKLFNLEGATTKT